MPNFRNSWVLLHGAVWLLGRCKLEPPYWILHHSKWYRPGRAIAWLDYHESGQRNLGSGGCPCPSIPLSWSHPWLHLTSFTSLSAQGIRAFSSKDGHCLLVGERSQPHIFPQISCLVPPAEATTKAPSSDAMINFLKGSIPKQWWMVGNAEMPIETTSNSEQHFQTSRYIYTSKESQWHHLQKKSSCFIYAGNK